MQYFKNNPRRCTQAPSCPSDLFPLCRNDRGDTSERRCACNTGSTASSCPYPPSGSTSQSQSSCADPIKNCANVNTPTSEDFECEGLAIALVPMEEFGDINSPEDALCRGSLFQRLDMPFYGPRKRGCK